MFFQNIFHGRVNRTAGYIALLWNSMLTVAHSSSAYDKQLAIIHRPTKLYDNCNLSRSQLNTTSDSHVTSPLTNEFPLSAGKFDDTKQNHMTRALATVCVCACMHVCRFCGHSCWQSSLENLPCDARVVDRKVRRRKAERDGSSAGAGVFVSRVM